MKIAATLVVGFCLGAGTVLMLRRLQEVVCEENADSLTDRIDAQLAELEERTSKKRAKA